MNYVALRIQRLKARLARCQATLATLYTALDESAASNVESYSFESGDGRQSTSRRSVKDIQDLIERLEAEEEHLVNELSNMGLISVAVRRIMP